MFVGLGLTLQNALADRTIAPIDTLRGVVRQEHVHCSVDVADVILGWSVARKLNRRRLESSTKEQSVHEPQTNTTSSCLHTPVL